MHRIVAAYQRSLSTKALVGIVLVVGLIMAVSTFYHFHSASAEAENALRQRGERFVALLADTLARPLFDYNHVAVASAVQAIASSDDIGAIRVRDADGSHVASAGKWDDGETARLGLQSPILFPDAGELVPVGTLQLQLLRQDVERQLRIALWRTIVTNALLGLAIVAFLFVLARRTGRDFSALLAALESLRRGETSGQVAGIERQDEIGRLAQTVDSFREAIVSRQAAEMAQKRLQEELLAEREHAAREALDRSQEHYRLVVENVAEGIAVVQDGRIVFANAGASRITGHSKEALGATSFIEFVHPDDRALVLDRHMRRLQGDAIPSHYAFRLLHRNGGEVWVELSAVNFEWEGKAATLSFISDITQRHQADEDIRRALEKQRELNDLKSRFVSMTSHEFRTPLATILSSIELLKYYDDRLTSEDKTELLVSVENAIKRMTRMLDDILVIGRADAGRIEFQVAPANPREICRAVAEETALAAASPEAAQRRVHTDFQEGMGQRLLDDNLLRHILGNLLSNALKYSPEANPVLLKVCADESSLELTVSDRGIGIPTEDIPRLFDSFHRAGNVGNIAGTGLGMAIVRRAVDLHGGEIFVDSHVGAGSVFRVRLPAPRC